MPIERGKKALRSSHGVRSDVVLYSMHSRYAMKQAARAIGRDFGRFSVRIGMFADMYKPYISGVTNHIAITKAALEELGHEVWVFTFGSNNYEDDEPRVIRSPGLPFGDTGWQFGATFSRDALDAIRTLDVAHAHHPFLSGRLALKTCKKPGIPVVMTNHTRYDLYSDVYARFAPKTLRYWFLRWQLASLYSKAALVISPSAEISEWLRSFGIQAPTRVLPNAIDTRKFREPRSPLAKSEIGFAEDDVVFCYLGRLGEEKNLSLLTEAFVAAAKREPRCALLLIGGGPSKAAIEKRAAEAGLAGHVNLAGLVDYARVPDYLAAADVFVTASVSEVHPLTVMEGMAAGLPVVAIRSPGIAETVTNEYDGLLANSQDPQLLATLMVKAADDELRAQMSEAALASAAERDISKTAAELAEIYATLAETAKA